MSGANGALATGLRILTRDEIVAAHDLAREVVPMPEWGEDVAVLATGLDVNRRLAYREYVTIREKDAEGNPTFVGRDDINYNAVLATLGIINEAGEPVFTLADLELLQAHDPVPIERIGEVVRRLSRIGKYAVVQAEAPLVQNGASHTALPSPSGA